MFFKKRDLFQRAKTRSRRFFKRKKKIYKATLRNLKKERPNLSLKDLEDYKKAFHVVWNRDIVSIFDKAIKEGHGKFKELIISVYTDKTITKKHGSKGSGSDCLDDNPTRF